MKLADGAILVEVSIIVRSKAMMLFHVSVNTRAPSNITSVMLQNITTHVPAT